VRARARARGPARARRSEGAADPTDPGHEKALEAWTALPEPQRVERVLAGIASEDRTVARFYAALADPYVLSLEEIRRVMAICAEDPAWVADPLRELPGGLGSNGLGFGTPDLPAIAKTAATTPDLVFFVGKSGGADRVPPGPGRVRGRRARALPRDEERWRAQAHRRMARPGRQPHDATRRGPAFARGFLYLVERAAAVKAGKPVPRSPPSR
jgi:hypothetical protein